MTVLDRTRRRGALWANRDWLLLFSGQSVSVLGDAVFDTTIVLWIGTVVARGQSWAPTAVSGALVATAVPVLVVGPIAGVYVDRWDHRRTMMVADLIRAVLIGALIFVAVDTRSLPVGPQLALVYGILALSSATSQFFNPARFAMIGSVVAEPDQARAFSLSQASVSTASVLGPPLAAPLLFVAGIQWALVINALSFVVSLVAVRAIRFRARTRSEQGPPQGFRAEFVRGVRFFATSRLLVLVAVSLCVYTLGVGAINVLNVFFVGENLRVSPDWLGTVSAGFGIGAVGGSLLAAAIARRVGEARLYCLGLSAAGLAIILYSRATGLPAGLTVLALAGAPVGMVSAVASPLVLRATPDHLLGRVMAVLNPLMQLASIVSMAVSGYLASSVLLGLDARVAGIHFGRIDAVFGVSGLLMLVSGLLTLAPLARLARTAGSAPAAESP